MQRKVLIFLFKVYIIIEAQLAFLSAARAEFMELNVIPAVLRLVDKVGSKVSD